MMTEFPRLLVATEFPPNAAGGGAAIVRQMLREWPAEKLFWWSCFPDNNQLFGRKVAMHCVASIPPKIYPNKKWRAQKSLLLDLFWLPWATGHLRKTLEICKPEAVWVIPHCWSIPPQARALLNVRTGYHVSIHDYADVEAAVTRFGVERTRQMTAMTKQLYTAATTRDAICKEMVDDLRQQTGRDGLIVHAGLEQEDFDYLSTPPPASGDIIRIAYAGTIIAEKAFAIFVNTLGKIRQQLPRPLTLDFFGDDAYRSRSWFDSSWMKEHGSLSSQQLSKALKECTWGFSPMELTDDNPRYNRFSLPAKFTSYLGSGLPILTLGHPESTVIKMSMRYQVGLAMTGDDLEKLGVQLLAALSEPNPKTKYRAEIQRCALAEFDARQMRTTLYENFTKCANASK
jgi:hypothetical protein